MISLSEILMMGNTRITLFLSWKSLQRIGTQLKWNHRMMKLNMNRKRWKILLRLTMKETISNMRLIQWISCMVDY